MAERTSQGFRREAKPLAIAGAGSAAVTAGAAEATTLDESAFGVGDFGNTFATKTLLPVGTDVVNGMLDQEIGGDFNDFVTFQSLPPALAFELEATSSQDDLNLNLFFLDQFNDDGTSVQSGTGPSVMLTGTIPASGQLHFHMNLEGSALSYQLALNVVPEPSTVVLLGAGLIVAAAWRGARRNRDG